MIIDSGPSLQSILELPVRIVGRRFHGSVVQSSVIVVVVIVVPAMPSIALALALSLFKPDSRRGRSAERSSSGFLIKEIDR